MGEVLDLGRLRSRLRADARGDRAGVLARVRAEHPAGTARPGHLLHGGNLAHLLDGRGRTGCGLTADGATPAPASTARCPACSW